MMVGFGWVGLMTVVTWTVECWMRVRWLLEMQHWVKRTESVVAPGIQ